MTPPETRPADPPNYPPNDPKAALVALVRRVADRLGVEKIGLTTFLREAGIGAGRVYRHFEGWPELCAAAGLEPHLVNRRVPDAAIFAAMRAVFLRHGGPCTKAQFVAGAPFGHCVPGHWTPHATVARRLSPEQIGAALTAARGLTTDLASRIVGLRRWDSDQRIDHILVG